MNIVVASNNPVKIQASLSGFQQIFLHESFTAQGISVPSGVSDQPMSDEETLQGALNRAANASNAVPDANYWVGIEGGCEQKLGQLWTFAWVVVLGMHPIPRRGWRDMEGVFGSARTAAFRLPHEVAELVRSGIELGEADDQIFGRSNSKQSNGAVGLLTGDIIDRKQYYEHAVVLALIPFKNTALRWV